MTAQDLADGSGMIILEEAAPISEEVMERLVKPLTPAEKQKAYRQRIKADPVRYETYLEKERMRKSEKGLSRSVRREVKKVAG